MTRSERFNRREQGRLRTQKVTIIGAGIAGLSAALRLAQRGYRVTIYEQDGFVGGKFRATEWLSHDGNGSAFHEHSYHMFLNWYHNFWQIAEEIGVAQGFLPMSNVKFLRKGEFPHMSSLESFGSLTRICHNLFAGVIPAPDMFLYIYSMLDLLSTPMKQNRFQDLISVNAFSATKPYTTETSDSMYDEYLAKTFAVASYQSSAKTFQTFLQYGTYHPDPLYWSLAGDCYNHFLRLFQTKLEELDVRFVFHHQAKDIKLDDSGNVCQIVFYQLPETFHPTLNETSIRRAIARKRISKDAVSEVVVEVDGPLILAVPHAALYDLLNPDLLNHDQALGEGAKLQSVPMASVHLHLNGKFAQRLEDLGKELPREPVVLLDSRFKLSFVANSRLWPRSQHTYLNIVSSDSRPLGKLEPPWMYTSDRDLYPDGPDLSIDKPATTLDCILNEFRRFVHFEDDEIDKDLLQIDRNTGRELLINEVGSWKWRPKTRTRIRNLFLAGDFCKNFIDVVCLEGAVVSGLHAADCVRRECGLGAPIVIKRPRKYPYPLFWPLKLALAPYAVGAKLWSSVNDLLGV
jgi:zeta-carotene desaturase